jgi:hypothetical protein
MKPRVRIGTTSDQDRWRREDTRALSPDQRFDMLLRMQASFFGEACGHIRRIVKIRSNGATAS